MKFQVDVDGKEKVYCNFYFSSYHFNFFYFIFLVTSACETTNDFHCGILPLILLHLFTTSAALVFSHLLVKNKNVIIVNSLSFIPCVYLLCNFLNLFFFYCNFCIFCTYLVGVEIYV